MTEDYQHIDLKATVGGISKYVTQIIHFVGGEKRTFHGIDTQSFNQGQFTKFKTKDGRFVMINDKNILCIETFAEEDKNIG
tara:strand:+ start:456 stop:698 length:243 start_codon:yes stop_codon:yes gene_type:complete